jgi:hypothetical protein
MLHVASDIACHTWHMARDILHVTHACGTWDTTCYTCIWHVRYYMLHMAHTTCYTCIWHVRYYMLHMAHTTCYTWHILHVTHGTWHTMPEVWRRTTRQTCSKVMKCIRNMEYMIWNPQTWGLASNPYGAVPSYGAVPFMRISLLRIWC